AVCREYEVIVLSDEIYSRITFNSPTAPSIATYYPERTFIFSGMSKIFSAGGYRCGFMATPKELAHLKMSFQSLFSETFSAVASPIQYAALTAFKGSDGLDDYVMRNAQILTLIGSYVYSELSAAGIRCTKPEGAFYMMVDFSPFQDKLDALGIQTSESLAVYFLDHLGVALLPGSDFYFPPEKPIFRLAFVDFNGVVWPRTATKEEGKADIKKYSPKITEGVAKLVAFCQSK
ncbi:MAG: pyridoxal phosphate-dependent aminotransferase, partial [Eudoraea sp.]|nr:pyridoxal phosphate-dependent aminotransferase [Eudoraea sp.]